MATVPKYGPEPLTDAAGNVLTDVDINVYTADGTTAATIYSDRALTQAITQPFTPDAAGNIEFYVGDSNEYVIAVTDDATEIGRFKVEIGSTGNVVDSGNVLGGAANFGNSLAVHPSATIDSGGSGFGVAIGDGTYSWTSGVCVGWGSEAWNSSTTAIGTQASARGSSGVAVGREASCASQNGVALGREASSTGVPGGIAIGYQARVGSVDNNGNGFYGVALGHNVKNELDYTGVLGTAAATLNDTYNWQVPGRLAVGEQLRPLTDNTLDLGMSWSRFQDIYATNATIQTSDVTEKADVTPMDQDAALSRVRRLADEGTIQFRWPDGSRTHAGFSAQKVGEVHGAESAAFIDPSIAASKQTNPFAGPPDRAWIDGQIPDDPDMSAEDVARLEDQLRAAWARQRQRFAEEIATAKAAPKGVRTAELIPDLYAAIAAQQKQIEDLTARVAALEGAA